MSSELIFLFLAAALVVFGAVGLVLTRNRGRKRAQAEEAVTDEAVTVVSDWKPTGKIDFACPEPLKDENGPAAFVLRVEEYRILQSLSGTRRVEVRWRNATLQDAKRVVSRHNATDSVLGRETRRLVGAPSIVPHSAADDDNPDIEVTGASGNGRAS